jgi:hypothetical protein
MSDYEITDAMVLYGGRFVAGLGRLFRTADAINQAKLKAAFPEYFAEYAALATLKQQRAAAR